MVLLIPRLLRELHWKITKVSKAELKSDRPYGPCFGPTWRNVSGRRCGATKGHLYQLQEANNFVFAYGNPNGAKSDYHVEFFMR